MDWVTARNRKDKVVEMMKRDEWRAVIQVIIVRIHGDNDIVTWCRSSKETMTTENLCWSGSNPPWLPSPSYKLRCPS